MEELFGREGIEEIIAEGAQFDPFKHEVVSKVASETQPENTIISVIRKGYVFRGKVIRPAMVTIAIKGKKKRKKKCGQKKGGQRATGKLNPCKSASKKNVWWPALQATHYISHSYDFRLRYASLPATLIAQSNRSPSGVNA
ncbi:nucleotide exchange factor GrpE [ANME-1 cluster archaeon AG-394-G21]|nr:nucleotide exchange factor GrpE [ANME-1 cluster archaeon AG-394-G21]